ncbi:Methylcytosine dioxygenase TET1 [Plecturocebus cupreus]
MQHGGFQWANCYAFQLISAQLLTKHPSSHMNIQMLQICFYTNLKLIQDQNQNKFCSSDIGAVVPRICISCLQEIMKWGFQNLDSDDLSLQDAAHTQIEDVATQLTQLVSIIKFNYIKLQDKKLQVHHKPCGM